MMGLWEVSWHDAQGRLTVRVWTTFRSACADAKYLWWLQGRAGDKPLIRQQSRLP